MFGIYLPACVFSFFFLLFLFWCLEGIHSIEFFFFYYYYCLVISQQDFFSFVTGLNE